MIIIFIYIYIYIKIFTGEWRNRCLFKFQKDMVCKNKIFNQFINIVCIYIELLEKILEKNNYYGYMIYK